MPSYDYLRPVTSQELIENERLLDETFLPIADAFLRKERGSALLSFLGSGLGAVGAMYYWDDLPLSSQEAIKKLSKTRIRTVSSDKRIFHWVTSPLMEAYLEVDADGQASKTYRREDIAAGASTDTLQVTTPEATLRHTVHAGDYVFFFNKYNEVARGRVESVAPASSAAGEKDGTLTILWGYDIGPKQDSITIPGLNRGDRGEVAFRSYAECECGDVECFENTRPCEQIAYIPLHKFCFEACKDFFVNDYDPSKTKFSRSELYKYNAMAAFSRRLEATLWDQAEGRMVEEDGREVMTAGGLRWYAETFGRTVVIDSCCLHEVMKVLREVSTLRMQSASGEQITNNEWVVFCGADALQKIQGVIPETQIDYIKEFSSLRDEQEAYMTLGDYNIIGFKTGGAKFIFVEEPYLTRTTPDMAYAVLIDAITFVTLQEQHIQSNIFPGQDRHVVDYGGIFRDITRPEDVRPDSDCPVKIRIEMNLRLHILNPEHMAVLYLPECGTCSREDLGDVSATAWIDKANADDDWENGKDFFNQDKAEYHPQGNQANPWNVVPEDDSVSGS